MFSKQNALPYRLIPMKLAQVVAHLMTVNGMMFQEYPSYINCDTDKKSFVLQTKCPSL